MNKIAYITGASGNLGKAASERFLRDGYTVCGTIYPGEELNYQASGKLEIDQVNLADEAKARHSVDGVIRKYKKIDVALLLVGGFAMGGIADTDGDALKKMYTLNFETAYHTARPIFLQMMKQVSGGRIVLVGAKPALNASQGKDMIAYGLSKSLLFKLAEYLNAEGSTNNVVTSVIIPSTIDTPQNRASMPDADFRNWVQPEVIAETMAFICSDHGMALRGPIFKVYGKS